MSDEQAVRLMSDEQAVLVWAYALRTLTYDPAETVLRLIQRWVTG